MGGLDFNLGFPVNSNPSNRSAGEQAQHKRGIHFVVVRALEHPLKRAKAKEFSQPNGLRVQAGTQPYALTLRSSVLAKPFCDDAVTITVAVDPPVTACNEGLTLKVNFGCSRANLWSGQLPSQPSASAL